MNRPASSSDAARRPAADTRPAAAATTRPLPPPPAGQIGWPWRERPARLPPRAPGGAPWPRITVVVPSFRQGRFLEACLRSLLLQGYPELELMVVDGGSEDESVEVLERYDAHLAWWVSEPDRGQAHAINRGFARARGEILGWLNADDVLLPRALERIAGVFVRRPETSVVAGLRHELDAAGRRRRRWLGDLPRPRRLRAYCCVAQETVYWRREVYRRIGPLDESMSFALDYEYWLRMLDAGYRFILLPRYLGGCRDHPATKRATRDDARRADLRRIRRTYRLGRSEEEALMRQGPGWSARLALIEDLETSPLAAWPRLAVALLAALERPRLERLALSLYRRYRHRRPRAGARRAGRALAAAAAVWGELRGGDVPDHREPWLLPASPVQRPLLPAELEPEELALLPPDHLALGRGWSWLECSTDRVYRWADDGGELLVFRPSGRRRRLLLAVESGPSLGWGPFPLEVVDEAGAVVARGEVAPRQVLALDLPLAAGPSVRRFRLRVPSAGRPASEHDPRVLSFRLTGCRWADETPAFDLPLEDGGTVQLVLPFASDPAADVVPPSPLRPGMGRRALAALPVDGLFLGLGWDPPAGDDRGPYRRAASGAQIVVSRASGARRELEVELELESDAAASFEPGLELRLEGDAGALARAPLPAAGGVVLAIALERDRTAALRLELRRPDDAAPATCILRLRRLGWAS